MKLYFMRHSDAEQGADDAARRLTSKGEQESELIGQFLAKAGIVFDKAYSSPLVRAIQTCEIVLKIINLSNPIKPEITEKLLNETKQEEFEDWLRTLTGNKKILLVGHSPSLDERVSNLLSCRGMMAIKMPKSAVICIDSDNGVDGTLEFCITPKILRTQ